MQVKMQVFRYGYAAADKHTSVVWILFDDSSIEDGFDDMFALKTFFQGVLHRVALDEVVSGPYSFADDFDVHTKRPFVNKIARELLSVPAKLL
jgi:hypothetical protein